MDAQQPAFTLSAKAAARRLSVGYDTLLKLVARGELVAVDMSAGSRPRYRIAPQDIDDFVRRRMTAQQLGEAEDGESREDGQGKTAGPS